MFQCECCGKMVGPKIKAQIRQVQMGAHGSVAPAVNADGFVSYKPVPPAPQIRGVQVCVDCCEGLDKGIPFSALKKQRTHRLNLLLEDSPESRQFHKKVQQGLTPAKIEEFVNSTKKPTRSKKVQVDTLIQQLDLQSAGAPRAKKTGKPPKPPVKQAKRPIQRPNPRKSNGKETPRSTMEEG